MKILWCWCLISILYSYNLQAEILDLSHLKKEHPRLIISADFWNNLNSRRKNEIVLDKILSRIEIEANLILGLPVLTYQKEGKRLLAISREAIRRSFILIYAYKLSHEEKYKIRLENELKTLANFSDWNPSHFLDVAEMTTALAFAYDWMYQDWSIETKKILKDAILNKGIKAGISNQLPNTNWYKTENNWNQVCLGGLGIGALAIFTDEPESAAKMLEQVKLNIVNGLKPYAPDGIYPEGPGYWAFGTTYQVLFNESIKSALGTDWDLSQAVGFKKSIDALMELTGPTRKYFNFSDGNDKLAIEPAIFWFSQKLERPDLLYFQWELLEKYLGNYKEKADRFFPLITVWNNNFNYAKVEPIIPLNWSATGNQPIATFRSSWTDPNAFYFAIKGGSASLNHAHMDAGSFILDWQGERWAMDLGAQNYFSLESKNIDLWNKSQNSQRWNVFKLNNFGHNTLTINNALHEVAGNAKILNITSDKEQVHLEIDLSSIFSKQAKKVMRKINITNNKKIEITDEFIGLKDDSTIHWNLITDAAIELNKNEAILIKNGKKIKLKITSKGEAIFKKRPLDPPMNDFDDKNPGKSALFIDIKLVKEVKKIIAVEIMKE